MTNATATPSGPPGADGERPVRRALQAGCALLLGFAAAPIVRPGRALMDLPLTEDGFLALAISRNVGTGNGVTTDGTQLTNGFQPLWVFLMAPAHAAAALAQIDPLRIVLAAHWLCFAATGFLLAGTVTSALRRPSNGSRRDDLLYWTAAFLFFAAPVLHLHCFNGLETGLSLLLLTCVARTALSTDCFSLRGSALFGALLGVAVLARVDAALLVASLTFAMLVVPREIPIAARLRAACVAGGTAVIVSSPWWIFNVVISGTVVPTSASAQSESGLDAERIVHAVRALLSGVFPWAYAGAGAAHKMSYVHYALAAAALAAFRFRDRLGIRLAAPRPAEWSSRARTFALGCALFVAALFAYYASTSFAWWFYERYLAPVGLVGVGAASIATAAYLRRMLRLRGTRRAAVVAGAGVLAACVPVAALGLYYGGPVGRTPPVSYYLRDQLALVEAHARPSDLVGASQSGTLGYARPHVINLDGKVNPEALRNRGRMPDYMREKGIRWFCDWDWCVHSCLGDDPARAGWSRAATSGIFELWRRDD